MLCLICLLAQTVSAKEVSITGARISTNPQNSRIVLDMSSNTHFSAFTLANPLRLVLDLPNAFLTARLNQLRLADSPITNIRVSSKTKDTLRIVFDLKSAVTEKIFWLEGKGNPRLVIDLQNKIPLDVSQKKVINRIFTDKDENKQKRFAMEEKVQPQVTASIADLAKRQRDIIIVIDPGHGGKDPGAIGPHGVREKDVVLAISRQLQRYLNTVPGISAVLTRNNDYFIPLRGRLHLARRDKADFFVAIHADSFYYKFARGASVFALSERGATSEAARWLAEKENYSELSGVSLNNKSYMLRSVLIDLSQTATISQSVEVGQAILNALDDITPLHHYSVEQAPFMVLKSPDIPSLLVETGFITNPYEEANLSSSRYQKRMAQSIAGGIIGYFRHHPPPGTRFAALKNAHQYAANN
jgi:N-acetylmuramoyl-L-alanine amidase